MAPQSKFKRFIKQNTAIISGLPYKPNVAKLKHARPQRVPRRRKGQVQALRPPADRHWLPDTGCQTFICRSPPELGCPHRDKRRGLEKHFTRQP